jgi:hypothetical protein
MPKFYVHRTQLAYVTEVIEIEADNAQEAEQRVEDGNGEFIGLHVGDYSEFGPDESVETLDAAPHNLPTPFYLAKAAA